MSKLVVFDVDGTILNSWGFFERIVGEYAGMNNLPMPNFEVIKRYYSEILDHDIGWDMNREDKAYHCEQMFRLCDARAAEEMPYMFDGVEDTLVHLKDTGHTLAIITSKPEQPLIEVLEYHGLYTLFSAHRARCDVRRRGEEEKPAPDMLRSVMRELNFVPEETVMIGDTTMDVGMGRNAKTGTIGVTWGAHPKEMLLSAKAHFIVETKVPDLVPVIAQDFFYE